MSKKISSELRDKYSRLSYDELDKAIRKYFYGNNPVPKHGRLPNKPFNSLTMEQQQKWELTPEQKAYKQSKDLLKSTIKKFADHQRVLNKLLRIPHDGRAAGIQSTRMVNRYDLRHYHLAYAIIRNNHGGYTKLKKLWPNKPDGVAHIAQIDLLDINFAYLTSIIDKHVPKTVHINP